MKTCQLAFITLVLFASTLPSTASGPILMVHGHADDPSLWIVQGNALARASANTRFYDQVWYFAEQLPTSFKSNGIYGVTYYSRTGTSSWQAAPISPVRAGSIELPPDDPNLVPVLYQQPDSYAARLAVIINRAYADTGQKVTLICHSMGGLVSLSTVAWFGVSNKVEKIITIGSPLRGFPPDFRIPADIIGLDRTGLFREGLQMSEGITYDDGKSFSEIVEDRFKRTKPASLSAVNIVGTLSPFPTNFLGGSSDGVVRTLDQRFRDVSLATVYELPLLHNATLGKAGYSEEDVECLSSRTTLLLEKEVFGLEPLPRLGTALAFNFATQRLRVTVRNDGGLQVTFSSVSGRFEFLGPSGRIASDPLSGLAGQTLQPGQSRTVNGLLMPRGERGDVRLVLTVNGRELPPSDPTWIANIQAPEIGASLRYDLANSLIQNEWAKLTGGTVWPIVWDVRYRLEGNAYYDAGSNRLRGDLTAYFYSASTGLVATATSETFFKESFSFDLDPATRIFKEVGATVLGKTPLIMDDAAHSRLRELYRESLLPLVSRPGSFVVEGNFSAAAGVKLDRPVIRYDPENQGVALNINATLYFAFTNAASDQIIELPIQASCSMTFVNNERGLVMKPRIRKLSLPGFSLGQKDRLQINKLIEANEFVLVPASVGEAANESVRQALVSLGLPASPANFNAFDRFTVAVDPSPTRLRLLLDFYDDAMNGGQNTSAAVPENGISVQDRLLNEFLKRSIRHITSALEAGGGNTFYVHQELLEKGTGGLIGQSAAYYVDRVNIIPSEDQGQRALGIHFLGPENRTWIDVSLKANFYNQIRWYLTFTLDFGFWSYTERRQIGSIGFREVLDADLDLVLHPYLKSSPPLLEPEDKDFSSSMNTVLGILFRPREMDVDFNPGISLDQTASLVTGLPIPRFGESTLSPIPILAEVVAEPLLGLVRNNSAFLPLFTGIVGAVAAYVNPNLLFKGPEDRFNEEQYGGEFTSIKDGNGRFNLGFQNYDDLHEVKFVAAQIGFLAGAMGANEISSKFDPKKVESVVNLPAGLLATNLLIADGAASLALDLIASYGNLSVTAVTGLDATNGIVQLSPDDLAFDGGDIKRFALTHTVDGDSRPFSALWVKKPVPKLRFKFRYDAMFAGRYNNSRFPGYTLSYGQVNGSAFTVPADFAYDAESDTGTFSVDIPVLEGVGSPHILQLKVPQRKVLNVPFLVGKDTAPLLISVSAASYSGVSSNVLLQFGTRAFRNESAPVPAFVLEDLKLLNLADQTSLTDLKPLAPPSAQFLHPFYTHVTRLYGVDYSWQGILPPNAYPEGLYAALVTIRETGLNRRGSLLIPVVIDRTPPNLQVHKVNPTQTVVSRHRDLQLVWNLEDQFSAVMHDVFLTYQKHQVGLVTTGSVFAAGGQVVIRGERRLDFNVDLSSVTNDVEEFYNLQFHAADVPGNRGVSSNLTFLVDTRPPSLGPLFVYPAAVGPYHAIVNESNLLLTVQVQSHEPVTVRFMLTDSKGSTNSWFAASSPLGNSGSHQALWILELPSMDPEQGLLEGVVADGVYQLSVELVDRGNNTNTFTNLKTILVDRKPPVLSFASQQTFLPAGRSTYPLDLSAAGLGPDDEITSISLVDLNSFTATASVYSATLRTWTGNQIAGILTSGVPMDPNVPGTILTPGRYGVEIKARDAAGNESSVRTQFGFQLLRPHVEALGAPTVNGIVPLVGMAVDPNPTDSFPFVSRELYWTFGASVPAPTNLNAINPDLWKKSGIYVLPPRGAGFGAKDNMSGEMVSQGILGYWNTTSAALVLDGEQPVAIPPANIINSDVTLLLVVRDQGGQAWAATSGVRVDNRQADINALTMPGVSKLMTTVTNQQLNVSAALFQDTPLLQMVVLDSQGNAVYRATRSSIESHNKLFGRPTYSLEKDFGFFVWFDESTKQVKVRCLSPEKDSQGAVLSKGHTFYFSLRGTFATNDLGYHQLAASEIPAGERVFTTAEGVSRVAFALQVAPGTEKGVAINYRGGAIGFDALGIDEYLQVLYENGPVVEKRFWRADDEASVTLGYLSMSRIKNLMGLDGVVMNGAAPELEDQRAVAHHTGVAGHLFVGQRRSEPISPMGLVFDSAAIQPDVTMAWDLKLPNGSYAEPGQYQVYLYAIDNRAKRFHGAQGAFTLSPATVPFNVSGMQFSGNGTFNPTSDGGIILNFNSTRSATATVQILNSLNQVVATIASGQFIEGRTDTNSPHRVWWDGFVNGVPATAGSYSFLLSLVTDGVAKTTNSGLFTVSYPANAPRDSDWGLLTQPIALDPDTRDRITRDPRGGAYSTNDHAWVTLRFGARLADGTSADAEKQVALERKGDRFESVLTDTNPDTYIPVSSLFGDAVQRFENVRVKFNDRVVDAFPPFDLASNNLNVVMHSRAGQFHLKILDNGPKALRLKVILRAQLKPWTNGLATVINEQNQLFDSQLVREFVTELEFREKPGADGMLQSEPWLFRLNERLWGYQTLGQYFAARYGSALLDNLREIEIQDRNGQQTLARFNSVQIRQGGTSAIEQLFTLTGFTTNAPSEAMPLALDFVFETRMSSLQAKAASLGVPVSFGYAGINAWLRIPDLAGIADDLDPFPTRSYHAGGLVADPLNGGQKFDNVKAYSGDSGLIQEIAFTTNRIAGHIPFEYSIRPYSDGTKGQQIMQIHPYVPYFFRKEPNTNYFDSGHYVRSAMAADLNRDGYSDLILNDSDTLILGGPRVPFSYALMGSATGLTNSNVAWAPTATVGVGDFNGDGYDDVIAVGDLDYTYDHVSEIYLGSINGLSNAPTWTIPGLALSVGDVNEDHYDDIAVGFPNVPSVLIYLGSATGLSNAPAWTINPAINEYPFVNDVSRAGDVNGDGLGDIFVYYEYGVNNDSYLRLYLATTDGWNNLPSWSIQFPLFSPPSYCTAGDVNGDGYGDVIVGFGQHADLFLGSPSGLSSTPVWTVTETNFFVSLGDSVSAGDFNGDGYADIVLGTHNHTNGNFNLTYVYLGSANGPTSVPDWTLTGEGTFLVEGGDFNGDGYDDISYRHSRRFYADGGVKVNFSPRGTVFYKGWVRGGVGGGVNLGRLPLTGVRNMLPVPLPNTQVNLEYDPVARRQRVKLTYSAAQSGYTTNAPFPVNPPEAAQWIAGKFLSATVMAMNDLPLDSNGQTNSTYANYLLNPKFGADTNDMLIAATPDAYDVVVTNGLVDYTHFHDPDPLYPSTLNYVSEKTAWDYAFSKLPTLGLPAVDTTPSKRPRLSLTNIVLHPDTSFPAVAPADLHLGFSEPDPAQDGWSTAFIVSAFSHEAKHYYRPWSLADDPNMQAAAQVQPENVHVTLVLSNYTYQSDLGLATNGALNLLNNVALSLTNGIPVTRLTSEARETSQSFLRFLSADLSILITRPSEYSGTGETEIMGLQKLDLAGSLRAYAVRSGRYKCEVTPFIAGPRSNYLTFRLEVTLDPPVEFSTRKPRRRADRIALPLKVIGREKFWQVDAGEFAANLFKEVTSAPFISSGAGYVIDNAVGFARISGRRLLATDPDYATKRDALFWKTSEGRIIQNPRIILGDLSVILKDLSGREESPAFWEKRYVSAITNEYFHDLYLDQKDLANLSWKAKIRPQAKEHAYVKVYGSVGGQWKLSYRKKENGQLSGLLPQDAGSLTWMKIANGTGRGQNQFLTYWDITELNGPHILRLESSESPDNSSPKPEAKYLDVMLGQHLPGRNNPIFSPSGQAETVSLFSMHGRTQLTSSPAERGDDDIFFTVNPIKIEERPFSLGTNGAIPLGERVQVLPHTEHNPLSVNFYIDQEEYGLYDQFRLYHQLEGGELAEITSLPPSLRPKYTLIQGQVEHTSIVGFLPNPSLRLCSLSTPKVSPDGIIRAAGAVDLYGTDNSGMKNEALTVAIVVSTNADFYAGQVKARLTTGAQAEFPIATEATQALIATDWTPGMSNRTYHVFAVVVGTNDDWLTLGRQLTPTDEGKHPFNVSRTTVTMTTNVNGLISIAGGRPIFSPNGDGTVDRIQFLLDFQRAGLVQLEFLNEVGQSVHLQSVPLNTNGQASFFWDGNITGQGALTVASDGIYTVIARYADGQAQANTAAVTVEVRGFSKYFGRLNLAGITNNSGVWRTLWTHVGGTVYNEDFVRIQYSDTANFAVIRGERLVDRPELSALFDDLPTNLAPLATDANGNLRVQYRLRVVDEVGNIGFSPVVAVDIPRSSRLTIASVTPLPGAASVSTEPAITILLSGASPFTVPELQTMLHLAPSVPGLLTLSPDRRTISFTPGAPYTPGTPVTASLQLYPYAVMPGSNTFSWSFSIISSNQISRSLEFRLLNVPGTLSGIGSEGTAFLLVTNRGNVPARLSVLSGPASPSVLVAAAPTNAALALPFTEISIPVSVTVTGQHDGSVSVPLTASDWSMGTITSLWMNVSVSSVTSPPSLLVTHDVVSTNAFQIKFAGQSQGNGTISTLARINGGSWWMVSQIPDWSFTATFASDGDVLEIVAMDGNNRSSATYAYTFTGPAFVLLMNRDRSMMWNAQLGRIYTIEWSTNLLQWATLPGAVQQSGSTVTVGSGNTPVQIVDAPSGRLSVRFNPDHSVITVPRVFFRVRSSTNYLDNPTASPSEFVLFIHPDRGLSWDSQAGQTYIVEWSTNLENWAAISGSPSRNGSTWTIAPGGSPVSLTDTPIGRMSVIFTSNHPAVFGPKTFFRIKSMP